MILSMTGFGRAVVENSLHRFIVEIKSLNSKQLDLSTRVSSAYRDMELEIRNIVARTLERGKVDLSIYVESLGDDTPTTFNIPVLQAYKAQIMEVSKELNIPEPEDWYSILLRFPETLHNDHSAEVSEDDSHTLLQGVEKAVAALMDFRAKEGKKLYEFFTKRIEAIGELLKEVPKYEQERIERVRNRLDEGLSKISTIDFDKGRLEQEMIFYIEKLDVSEEKQRLAQHLSYFLETMDGQAGQGKKLGFISQEMGREINTLGSKSNHAELQKLVVKMKDQLEQIKEQVLNVM